MKICIVRKHGQGVVDINRRKAIRELCLNCSGWIQKEVTNCNFADCDLYPFRTGKGKQNSKERAKAIRSYCIECMNGIKSNVRKCPLNKCPVFPFRKIGIDRSVEIEILSEKDHIEHVFEEKKETECIG